jgi:thiol-disulfide isomerase/thioredoxin
MLILAFLTIVGAAALALYAWLLAHLGAQQYRMWGRLDALTARLWTTAADQTLVIVDQEREAALNALAGKVAPAFDLAELGGGRLTLEALLAPAKPLLLVFTHPRCSPCYELLPDLGGWQRVYGDRLTIALVSAGEAKTNIAMTAEYGIRPVLLQEDQEVVEAFDLFQAPAAVVIQPDGRVSAGPRYGAIAIRRLVADTLGLVMPEAPGRDVQVAGIGKAAPRLRRPDLQGQVVEIGGPRREPTLLLFWSPGCSSCQAVLPDIKAFESAVERLRVVIVSRGPVGLNQEVGFHSPVVLDDDHSLTQVFGVGGTPAALLLDGRGVVVTQVARGAEGVRTALQAMATAFAPALTTA